MRFWFFLSLFISMQASAMSFLNPLKVCVFSKVNAQLILEGQPVANAKVTRRWHWGKEKFDEAVTDEKGYVHFLRYLNIPLPGCCR
jgi:hypothetical protein